MENYVMVNGKKLRKGYTTGSCAAAASKAAVSMLISGELLDSIDINTPAGIILHLPVSDADFSNGRVKCSVIKDGGDDPDMTTGLKIFAEAGFTPETGIWISAGEGIGTVTLPGLKVEAGKPAINPVPMKMILKEVQGVLGGDKGVDIILSAPGGREVAEKTFNPKLGIVDGISILGTTGIVTPMSEDAWKESLAAELGIAAARGLKHVVYAFGNYGEDFAVTSLNIDSEIIIKISNFLGFMLDKAVEYNFNELLLIGHLGKLVKVAAGIFHTHSRVADARMEIMAAYAALEGATLETVKKIYECRTTVAAAGIINESGLNGVYGRITSNASKRCSEYMYGKIKVGIVLSDENNNMLSMDGNAKEIF